MRDRFRGALVGVGVGDCFGAPFEGAETVSEQQWQSIASGDDKLRFTDDTHMTFGVVESLLTYPELDGAHMASIFMRDYEDEPWRGYGPGPPQVYSMIKGGLPWDEASKRLFDGAGSFGNGAAMRIAPIALVAHQDFDRLERMARGCASITHAHHLGMEGAAIQARAIASALLTPAGALDRQEFLTALEPSAHSVEFRRSLAILRELGNAPPSKIVSKLGNGVSAMESVPAAICCFLGAAGSFELAVARAVMLGGDTDTIAAMTGAMAGAYLGESGIPKGWRERAEGATSLGRMADVLLDQVTEFAHGK